MDRLVLEGIGKRYFRLSGAKLLAQGLFSSHAERNWFWSLRGVNLRADDGF